MKKFRQRRIESRAGTTLVETVVSMLVFGIVMTMVVGILSPAAKLFLRMERLQRAQVIMDNIIWELSAMAENASGYVKIYPPGTTETADAAGGQKGPILEFIGREGYATVISAQGCGATKIIVGGNEQLAQADPIKPGRLLTRYYYVKSTGEGEYEYQCKNDVGEPAARAVTEAFGDGYYMGNYLKIEFSFPSGVADEGKVTSLNADVSLYETDSDGNIGELVTQEKDVALYFRYALVREDDITAKTALTSP